MFFQIYRQLRAGILLAPIFFLVSTSLLSNAHETEFPGQKLAVIFPKAKKFVQRNAVLTQDKIASIEEELGAKLRAEDQKPIFYIPIDEINGKKRAIGLVLFIDVKGPRGVIDGAVGLNMQGKVVKVSVYAHKESDAIASEQFLKQFIGMGIDAAFKVGEDIAAVAGHEQASQAVALLPKKTLVLSYALFLKRKPKPEAEEYPATDSPEEDIPEVEDLKSLMALMIDDYYTVVDYFDTGEDKAKAVEAAKRLARYAKSISNFEPPKNADQTEEYVYLQDKFSETLFEFAKALEQGSISDEMRKQWDVIVALVNQAHLRFSAEEIDLEAY